MEKFFKRLTIENHRERMMYSQGDIVSEQRR